MGPLLGKSLYLVFVVDELTPFFQVLFVVLFGKRRQDFVATVKRAAAVLAGSHAGDDLGYLAGGHPDGVRYFHEGVADLEAVVEHVVKVNQAAVGHW